MLKQYWTYPDSPHYNHQALVMRLQQMEGLFATKWEIEHVRRHSNLWSTEEKWLLYEALGILDSLVEEAACGQQYIDCKYIDPYHPLYPQISVWSEYLQLFLFSGLIMDMYPNEKEHLINMVANFEWPEDYE